MPNTDQCTAVLTVTSPVPQLAEAAVYSASRNGVICPAAAETGSREVTLQIFLSGKTQTPYLLVETLTPTPMVEVTTQDFR